MAKPVQKSQALKLRKQGKTIPEIAKLLKVSKGSVSSWVKEVILSKKAQHILYVNKMRGSYKGRLIGALLNKNKKIKIQDTLREEALKNLCSLSDRDLLILGIGLFWGEGNKKGSRFIFANSDVQMILVMMFFLEKCMNIQKADMYISIQINEEHKKRTKEIIDFWSKKLKIDKSKILGPYFIKGKSKKVYLNSVKYFGIARLQVRKSSVLQYRILGYIRGLTAILKV